MHQDPFIRSPHGHPNFNPQKVTKVGVSVSIFIPHFAFAFLCTFFVALCWPLSKHVNFWTLQ